MKIGGGLCTFFVLTTIMLTFHGAVSLDFEAARPQDSDRASAIEVNPCSLLNYKSNGATLSPECARQKQNRRLSRSPYRRRYGGGGHGAIQAPCFHKSTARDSNGRCRHRYHSSAKREE